MSEQAEQMQLAFRFGAEEKPREVEREKTAPRFVLTGIVATYLIVLASIVASYWMMKGYV